MKRIILKRGEEDRILAGHPWVYDNEIDRVLDGTGAAKAARLEAGECADVEAVERGRPRYLGRAIVNPASKITARIYSRSKEGLDKGFFKRRLREAIARREAAGYNLRRDSARLVFAEADFLPGLVIDRYVGVSAPHSGETQSWLVIQFLAWGMDARRDMILAALAEVCAAYPPAPPFIVEKDAPVRELEGLPPAVTPERIPEIIIRENGLDFFADLSGGQKTGYFLDQRGNRRLAARYAAALSGGRFLRGESGAASGGHEAPLRILDCFSYTGGFALAAAKSALAAAEFSGAGPEAKIEVTAVDSSPPALTLARRNAALNGIELRTAEADVFEFLRGEGRRKAKYDLIILDPPAFAKTRQALEAALRGYREINLRAMNLLSKGGVLISSSCSQAVDEGAFKRMINEAAADAGRTLIQGDFRCQAADHPILVGYGESCYLKCGFYRVL
ncbi:MAG: class I SAM-dependent rRNA methyltransferase [Treponema sp.]|nr:class I SAM-dependent rRNA methyltransferase [Treponema sp.]